MNSDQVLNVSATALETWRQSMYGKRPLEDVLKAFTSAFVQTSFMQFGTFVHNVLEKGHELWRAGVFYDPETKMHGTAEELADVLRFRNEHPCMVAEKWIPRITHEYNGQLFRFTGRYDGLEYNHIMHDHKVTAKMLKPGWSFDYLYSMQPRVYLAMMQLHKFQFNIFTWSGDLEGSKKVSFERSIKFYAYDGMKQQILSETYAMIDMLRMMGWLDLILKHQDEKRKKREKQKAGNQGTAERSDQSA